MKAEQHVFHTKHDFSPELGWAAFQLLSGVGDEGVSGGELEEIGRLLASPLAVRSDLTKLLGAMHDLGLVDRRDNGICLSDAGRDLAAGMGRYRDGFFKAVHCIYFWQWLWSGQGTATPSWSYAEICRQIVSAGPAGVERDDLVLRVVVAAETFGAERVSFSRSSVSGVTMWLEAQNPALVGRDGSRYVAAGSRGLTPGNLRVHLAALCRTRGGEAWLDGDAVRLLSDALLAYPSDVLPRIIECCEASREFLVVSGAVPGVVLRQIDDPFMHFIAVGNRRQNHLASE